MLKKKIAAKITVLTSKTRIADTVPAVSIMRVGNRDEVVTSHNFFSVFRWTSLIRIISIVNIENIFLNVVGAPHHSGVMVIPEVYCCYSFPVILDGYRLNQEFLFWDREYQT